MRKILRVFVMAACCIPGGSALADGVAQTNRRGPAAIAAGQSLQSARPKLIRNGWKPVRRHGDDNYEYSGAELELTRRGIFEVDSCSSDSARCVLYYKKHGECLRVDTIGEKLRDMTVTRWVSECPDAPPAPSIPKS